jgi:hypothetical protein
MYKFDKGDWNWCPVHKGTDRQFECHKSITSEMVIKQIKHWDYPDSFWGNVELQYDDGIKGTSHSWQIEKVKNGTHRNS